MVGNVAARVAGHVEHTQAQRRSGQIHRVAFAQRMGDRGNRVRFPGGPVYRHFFLLQQSVHAARVVSVMMCQ